MTREPEDSKLEHVYVIVQFQLRREDTRRKIGFRQRPPLTSKILTAAGITVTLCPTSLHLKLAHCQAVLSLSRLWIAGLARSFSLTRPVA